MDFFAEYATKTDDELLRLALHLESLTPEAKSALTSTLRNRHLDSPARLAQFREEERQRLHHRKVSIGDLVLIVPLGMGRRMYGKANQVGDEYDATLFLVFFWLPLIPMGTYRIQEISPKSLSVIDRKPLDWRQVAFAWLKAAAVIVAIGLAIRVLAYFE
jgi:hypothetical protein